MFDGKTTKTESELWAEIERLRAALDEIAGLIDCDDAVVIARKALAHEQTEKKPETELAREARLARQEDR